MDTGTVTNRGTISTNPRIPRTTALPGGWRPWPQRASMSSFACLGQAHCPLERTEAGSRRWVSRRCHRARAAPGAVGARLGPGLDMGGAVVSRRRASSPTGWTERRGGASQQHAALAYHLAGMLVFDDPRKIRALRASASSLYARSLPVLRPAVRRIGDALESHAPAGLPGPAGERVWPAPLAVMLNGTSTSKEETPSGVTHFSSRVWPCWRWTGPGVEKAHCTYRRPWTVTISWKGVDDGLRRAGDRCHPHWSRGIQPGWRCRRPCRRQRPAGGSHRCRDSPLDPRPWFARAQPCCGGTWPLSPVARNSSN